MKGPAYTLVGPPKYYKMLQKFSETHQNHSKNTVKLLQSTAKYTKYSTVKIQLKILPSQQFSRQLSNCIALIAPAVQKIWFLQAKPTFFGALHI